MYQNEIIERLRKAGQTAGHRRLAEVSPVVWALGLTSFLTDISAEMVNSVLPVYLFIHLRLSPLEFGTIDGIYNGLSVAIVSLAAGAAADRWGRHKEAAAAGYGLSAVCKLLLLPAGGAWLWIMAALGLDRLGKGIRTAPRDAMISLAARRDELATAFGVHRSLDSAGALIGPLLAFFLLAQLNDDFQAVWLVSFLLALMGVAALWLLVPDREARARMAVESQSEPSTAGGQEAQAPGYIGLVVLGTLFAVTTVSDSFLYLLLQEKGQVGPGYLPLFYVVTAAAYMLFALPAGALADAWGRSGIFVSGYALLGLAYTALIFAESLSPALQIACLLTIGLYYAATEGVLMALASTMLPAGRRATGLALLVTCIGFGKLVSSLAFGWLWQTRGSDFALCVFLAGAALTLLVAVTWFRRGTGN